MLYVTEGAPMALASRSGLCSPEPLRPPLHEMDAAQRARCGTKKCYATRKAAKRAAKEYELISGDRMDSYRCPYCSTEQQHVYHMGHHLHFTEKIKRARQRGSG